MSTSHSKAMDPARWSLMGLEESLHTIDEVQKIIQRNPKDPHVFDDAKKNMVAIFRGLTERMIEHDQSQRKRLNDINEAFKLKTNLDPQSMAAKCESLKSENQDLYHRLKIANERINGYEADLKKLETKVKHLAGDAAQSKCEECKHKPRDVIFLPCKHFYACNDCAIPIEVCSYCSEPVENRIVAEF